MLKLPAMALSQKLAQFKKQQQNLQASLATIATRAKTPLPPPSASQPRAPLTQRFSFTYDTDNLQQLATIHKSPVGAQIKRVLHLLLQTRQSLLPEEINDLCFVDVKNNKNVFEGLKSNAKVSFDGQRFAYKSKHHLKNMEELLVLVRTLPDGVRMGDLENSYPGIATDVQVLKATGNVWVLVNSDSLEDIVYPNEFNIFFKVDEDLKQLIRGIDTPREIMDVVRELQNAGMKPATNSARRAGVRRSQIPKPEMEDRRESKRNKYTNAHLPELFISVE